MSGRAIPSDEQVRAAAAAFVAVAQSSPDGAAFLDGEGRLHVATSDTETFNAADALRAALAAALDGEEPAKPETGHFADKAGLDDPVIAAGVDAFWDAVGPGVDDHTPDSRVAFIVRQIYDAMKFAAIHKGDGR